LENLVQRGILTPLPCGAKVNRIGLHDMDIRRFAEPVIASVAVGIIVYALAASGQSTLRAEIEQLRLTHADMDKRFSDMDSLNKALVLRVDTLEGRIANLEKPPAPVTSEGAPAGQAPAEGAPAAPAPTEGAAPVAPPAAAAPVPAPAPATPEPAPKAH
jgi:hypothetical protein